MTEVTSDVAGGFESFGIEAVGVHLVAAMVAVSLIDCLAQFGVVRACLALYPVLAVQDSAVRSSTVRRCLQSR